MLVPDVSRLVKKGSAVSQLSWDTGGWILATKGMNEFAIKNIHPA
jgi:hypothetical protein